jgi:hypothetical protein
MKRKLFFALTAILSVGLMFVGCPNGTTDNPPSPPPEPSDFEKLEPWSPDEIIAPDSADYAAFPKGTPKDEDGEGGTGLLGNTAFYVTSGGEGFIEEGDNEGEYKVTVVTKPGGLSAIYFQDADYVYKTGFYLSLDLPEADGVENTHKPIGMTAFAATGPQESAENDWTSAQYVNNTGGTPAAITDTSVYLAGQVDFAWENANNAWPRRTIVLYIYWHADEEAAAEYTFTVNKILVNPKPDLTVPQYPSTAWMPTADTTTTEPTDGWTDFPSAGILGAAWAIGADTGSCNATAVTGGYEITVPTSTANTQIHIPASGDFVFTDGYYMSVELPDNTASNALRPIRFYVTTEYKGATDWTPAVDATAPQDSYVAGSFNIIKQMTAGTAYDGFFIQIGWHPTEPAGGSYKFTIKKLKVTEDEYVPPDPDDMAAWTPPAAEAPAGWVDYPADLAGTTFYPTWGGPKIEAKAGGGYTVTLRVRDQASDPGHSFVRIPAENFQFVGGYYLSLDLPAQTKESTMKPSRVYTYAASPANWNSAVDLQKANTWIEGKVDCFYEHAEFTAANSAIEIQIYWHPDAVGEQDYVFTIDPFLVKELTNEEPPPAETPDIHEDSQLEDALYALGDTPAALVVVPRWTENSQYYEFSWWQAESANADWPAVAVQWGGSTFIPPADAAGEFYYYCKVDYAAAGTFKVTRIVTITVTE